MEQGPYINQTEVAHALKISKSGKTVGPDGIHVELLKLLEDKGLIQITNLYNTIYKTGIIPHDWPKSTFIALPKKPNASDCNDHCTISLMGHALKVFLKIIHSRIYRKCESFLGETQFGFRNSMGTILYKRISSKMSGL